MISIEETSIKIIYIQILAYRLFMVMFLYAESKIFLRMKIVGLTRI